MEKEKIKQTLKSMFRDFIVFFLVFLLVVNSVLSYLGKHVMISCEMKLKPVNKENDKNKQLPEFIHPKSPDIKQIEVYKPDKTETHEVKYLDNDININITKPDENFLKVIISVYNIDMDQIFNELYEYTNDIKIFELKSKLPVEKMKPALIAIAKHESFNFKYNRGIYDKDDISVFQLSWKNKVVRDFAKHEKITKDELITNIDISAKIAMKTWIYNIYIFHKKRGFIPGYLQDLSALYHSISIKKYYVKKISKTLKEIKM